jgi:hypothetical protein
MAWKEKNITLNGNILFFLAIIQFSYLDLVVIMIDVINRWFSGD